MKLQSPLAFGLGLLFLTATQASAAETVTNPINEDLFFANGVQIQDVNEVSAGVANVALEGTGSLTVGNQTGGGFPRVTVLSGSTINSNRNWPAETVPKTSWDGQFTAPGSGRLPARNEVTFTYAADKGNEFEAVQAFVWGLSNETFSFSTPARFMFPVDEPDGQRLWFAPVSGSSWTVGSQNDYCVVESGLCYLELSSLGGLALIKQNYEACPAESVGNGQVGSTPNCIVTCDENYYIDNEGNECLVDAFAEEPIATEPEAPEEPITIDNLTSEEQADLNEFALAAEIDPIAILAALPGNVRPRFSGDTFRRYLIEYSDLSEEELVRVRHLNTGYLSRNKRSTEEQLAGNIKEDPAVARQKEDSFMTYLWQMRNRFDNPDSAIALESGAEGTLAAEVETGESIAAADGFHSSGGKSLPSTGPGLFIIIALIGFVLMLFGGIRRN